MRVVAACAAQACRACCGTRQTPNALAFALRSGRHVLFCELRRSHIGLSSLGREKSSLFGCSLHPILAHGSCKQPLFRRQFVFSRFISPGISLLPRTNYKYGDDRLPRSSSVAHLLRWQPNSGRLQPGPGGDLRPQQLELLQGG